MLTFQDDINTALESCCSASITDVREAVNDVESGEETESPDAADDVTDEPTEDDDVTDEQTLDDDVTDEPTEDDDVTEEPTEDQDVTDEPLSEEDTAAPEPDSLSQEQLLESVEVTIAGNEDDVSVMRIMNTCVKCFPKHAFLTNP